MKNPRILQLIGEFTNGGAENIVVNLSNKLRRENWEVIISARKDGPLSSLLSNKKCVYFINKQRTVDLKYLYKLVSLIREHNIDLIHSHLFGNDLFGFIAAKYAGIKIIQTIHGMDSFNSKKRVFAYNMMAPFVDKVVTVSESLEREMLKVVSLKKDKICTISNGIDLEKYDVTKDYQLIIEEIGMNNSFPIIGAVGNVKPVKGYDILIKAAVSIREQYHNAKFLIFGDTTEYKEYKEILDKLILKYDLTRQIKFMGYRSDVVKYLPIFDMYVLPSRSEGLSVALLEAMLFRKPIVATNVGGNMAALENGKNGLLVPPEDPEALSKSMLRLLSDKNLSKVLSANASGTVRTKYSLDKMTENYKELYLTIVS